jgi:hypothetical protein
MRFLDPRRVANRVRDSRPSRRGVVEAEADSASEVVEKNDAAAGERTTEIRTAAAVRDALPRSQAIIGGFLASPARRTQQMASSLWVERSSSLVRNRAVRLPVHLDQFAQHSFTLIS